MQDFTHTVVTHVASLSRFSYQRSTNATRSGYWTYDRYRSTTRQSLTLSGGRTIRKRALGPIHHIDGRAETQYVPKA